MLSKIFLALLSAAMLTTETQINDYIDSEVEATDVVTMCAVGDNLIHSPIYKKAKQSDGTYNFDKMYENVKDTISSYDLAVINQETMFVSDYSKISSYPRFGTPVDMGTSLIDTGFDVILGATNHSWSNKSFLGQRRIWGRYYVELLV